MENGTEVTEGGATNKVTDVIVDVTVVLPNVLSPSLIFTRPLGCTQVTDVRAADKIS